MGLTVASKHGPYYYYYYYYYEMSLGKMWEILSVCYSFLHIPRRDQPEWQKQWGTDSTTLHSPSRSPSTASHDHDDDVDEMQIDGEDEDPFKLDNLLSSSAEINRSTNCPTIEIESPKMSFRRLPSVD